MNPLIFGSKLSELAEREQQATVYRQYMPAAVPGLLQTEDYARAVTGAFYEEEPSEVEPVVQLRLARQEILTDPARQFHFILGEAAVRWQAGGKEVLQAQLAKLIAVSSAQPNVHLQVLPFTAPGGIAQITGFQLLQGQGEYLHIETAGGDLSRTGPSVFPAIFEKLQQQALDTQGTLDFLRSLHT